MPSRVPPKPARKQPLKDRRRPAGTPTTALGRLKGVIGRPMQFERQDGRLRVVMVERRRRTIPGEAMSLAEVCDELRDRLLTLGDELEEMRELTFLHHALKCEGWPAVHALEVSVIDQAIEQVRMLTDGDVTPPMAFLLDRLRLARLSVAARIARSETPAPGDAGPATPIEVLETSLEEFEQAERTWFDTTTTVPASLDHDK